MNKEILGPNLFILGVQKGGTSSLHNYLSESDEIFFPFKKELHFFDAYFEKGISWYLNHFNVVKNNIYKYSGEATPYYFFHPNIPKRIYSAFPKSKFIILFRNPIDRAFSHYQMSVRRGLEKKSFEDAIKAEKMLILKQRFRMLFNNRFNLLHAEASYLSRGMYSKQLKRWLKYFSLENFLFLKSEDLFTNPQPVINKVCGFLEISEIKITNFEAINQGFYNDNIKEKTRKHLQNLFLADIKNLEKITDIEFNWF